MLSHFEAQRKSGQDLPIDPGELSRVDSERFRNPPEYPSRAGVEWLFQRYPEVISREGVRTARFVDWMRPSAMPDLMKKIGTLKEPLAKGEKVLLQIGNRFPAERIDVAKKFVMISPSAVGGDAAPLGWCLNGTTGVFV
ncbi:unnamed protein product [Effrenium voratum]|uniref:Uncharacterized protein n=1 Tax=Effrenium voratum TaxID=2562239 RepID=A0AA36N7E9_9DINO|nr:unnamed protein product [Effrenium voratum]